MPFRKVNAQEEIKKAINENPLLEKEIERFDKKYEEAKVKKLTLGKRQSKCNICMKQAEEQYHKFGKSMLSKGYIYKLLREKCTHTEEERMS